MKRLQIVYLGAKSWGFYRLRAVYIYKGLIFAQIPSYDYSY